ncbi:hypothetical protein F0562_016856 [Nyssa sinensis]|uniref:Exostosin GT47 domain-containing protein n=1 Tax=Nyssa sinensis TaxID=561372 RepID=A0A5J4ZGM2_9ASTE|nr:hypothetical protein F0562_016856 [Nyssa sinensis]
MEDYKTKLSSWWSSFSSSPKILWFVIPLILVSAFVGLLRPKNSNWVFTSHNHPRPWRSPLPHPSSPSATIASTTMNSTKETEKQLGLQSRVEDGNHTEEALSNKSIPNRSSSPPLATEAMEIQEPDGEEEESLKMRSQKKYSNLERVEAGLAQARAAIKEAKNGNQTQDPDYIPSGPMYWNANAFHRSYLEMEKQFKVYVYEEGDPPVFHSGQCDGVLAIEGHFIHHMELQIMLMSLLPSTLIGIEASELITSCSLAMIGGLKSPLQFPILYKNSIRALCNANTSERFNLSRDVSIPEIFLPTGTTEGLLGGPSPSQRPILVFYAGGVHGPIRPILLEHWENKDEDVQVHKYLPKGVSYYGMMRKSKYCICPSGYEVASPRMVEGIYMGCVPVLIKDHYAIPFNDVLNWKAFSVIVPVKEIANLKKILMGISQKQYIKMQRRGLQVRKHFEVNLPPKRYDVFHMILHSIWLRRLNIRVYDVEES